PGGPGVAPRGEGQRVRHRDRCPGGDRWSRHRRPDGTDCADGEEESMTEPTPTAPAATDGGTVGQWRATYTPGSWVVLSGPTSMVVLQPAPAKASTLLNSMWDVVVSAASVDQLVERLAQFNVGTMPSFAAFFWHDGQMRSLVRGAVSVMDLTSGEYVADGEGIQTWSEIGLGDVRQVRIDMEGTPEESVDKLQLPLVVGAVTASAIVLDATDEVRVVSPQAVGAEPALAPTDPSVDRMSAEQAGAEQGAPQQGGTEAGGTEAGDTEAGDTEAGDTEAGGSDGVPVGAAVAAGAAAAGATGTDATDTDATDTETGGSDASGTDADGS